MRRQDESGRDQARFIVKIAAAVFVVLMVIVWEQVHAVSLEKDLRRLRGEVDRLTYENGRLQMQIHQWTTPSHLEMMAKQRYSMIPLDAAHVIGISK